MNQAVMARLDSQLIKKLKIIAIKENRKVSNLVGYIILDYLNKYEEEKEK